MAYATVDDLQVRFPRELTSAETDQAEVMLEDASFILDVQAWGLAQAVAAGDETVTHAAMLLVVAMVKRALLAQAAQQVVNPAVDSVSETWGTYSQSVRYRAPGGYLYLYDRELDDLLGLLRGNRADAVSMRSPGL